VGSGGAASSSWDPRKCTVEDDVNDDDTLSSDFDYDRLFGDSPAKPEQKKGPTKKDKKTKSKEKSEKKNTKRKRPKRLTRPKRPSDN